LRPATRQILISRETEVAVLAPRGLTNRDIAAWLCLSVRTIEVHIDHMLTKQGFRSRSQLPAWAPRQAVGVPGAIRRIVGATAGRTVSVGERK
jgi:DNA-binding NarL/FixJ family response regulator